MKWGKLCQTLKAGNRNLSRFFRGCIGLDWRGLTLVWEIFPVAVFLFKQRLILFFADYFCILQYLVPIKRGFMLFNFWGPSVEYKHFYKMESLNSLNTLKYELHFLSAYIPEVSININYIFFQLRYIRLNRCKYLKFA